MSLVNKDWKSGDLKGTIYLFENAGDLLSKHNHSEKLSHITFVLKGKLRVEYGNKMEVISAGDARDWPANEEHSFTAEEAGSKILNILKYS